MRSDEVLEVDEMIPAIANAEELDAQEPVNILLVDDRPENLLALESALEILDQSLVTASTGNEALRASLEKDFAVILLDVRLPDMDGFETASLLRERQRSRYTPIIFLTAVDKDDKQVSRGYSLGAVDYIFKPLDPDILRAKVSVFIDLYQKKRQIEHLNADLEERVLQRTAELEAANTDLEHQVRERKRAEDAVRQLNSELEERVRARTAELETANDELRAFSFSVSHDLRSPLRKIEAFSQFLVDEHGNEMGPGAHNYLDRIRAASRHMNALIEDMLKLSRVSREQMRKDDVDLSTLAQNILDDLQRSEPSRQVTTRVEPGLHARGDEDLLRIALDNLLGNAWKFTGEKSSAEIEFTSANYDDDAAFSIRDNGAGFDMAQSDKLFQAFQRLHPAKAFPGTGIGLAIVHRIVKRHGGRIRGEGEVGKGATFTFTLGD